MPNSKLSKPTMQALRFYEHGEPLEVLKLETVEVPAPGVGRIRIAVHACGLTPADSALCRGLFSSGLPRGIGLEVSGRVDAVGEGVDDVRVGDLVLGTPDWIDCPTAGMAGFAIMDRWTPVPAGLDLTDAATLPMAAETAFRSIDLLGVEEGQTVLVHGAGSTVGVAAVQIALMRRAQVVATAGDTYADKLRDLGATVTSYGEGMVERVRQLAGGSIDLVLDTAPVTGALPDLIEIAGGNPQHVLTISDFEGSEKLGTRNTGRDGTTLRYDVLPEFARLAADGRFTVPIGGTYPLEKWRDALQLSLSGKAKGKLVLMPANA
ncbi:NADP-dependent oxidoreductase [Sphingomonas sp.]|uniref:NADP-dependent oxidoreductase n=1 Tax=Sphingomonas sp. TaxID=28214 RepID=UPI003B009959